MTDCDKTNNKESPKETSTEGVVLINRILEAIAWKQQSKTLSALKMPGVSIEYLITRRVTTEYLKHQVHTQSISKHGE